MYNFTEAPVSGVHRKIAAGTFMGMISDGYTVGIIGISLSYAQQDLHFTEVWQGLIAASCIFGAVLGGFLSGMLSDKIGRRPLYALLMALVTLVSIWQFWLSSPFLLFAARFALGILNGSDYAVSITLLSEWSPERQREKFTALLIVFWTIGYSLSYITGFFMDGIVEALGSTGWRLILCTSALPGFLAFCLRLGSPESPVWLAARQKPEAALAVIRKHLGEFALPEQTGGPQESSSWFDLFAPEQWRHTFVSCFFFFAQFLPFLAISIFVPMVMARMGIANPLASGALYNASTLLGVFVGSWLYVVLTRRAFLLWTFYLAAALLAAILIWPQMPSFAALALILVFALVISASLVPEFSYPAELFPTELRGSGVGFTIAVSDLGAAAGTVFFPVIATHYGIQIVLWFCVLILLLGGIVCHLWAPETTARGRAKLR